MPGEQIIQLKNVSKQYAHTIAVNNISLTVSPGKLLVLLGGSGCGKTTTLRLIAGLENPDAGEIWLNGRLVASADRWVAPENRQIGMVFQDYALFPHLTVWQNIAFALKGTPQHQHKQRVTEMLEITGLGDRAQAYPHQLSGGQQQRVALARALAPAPAVVLLDEPFSNLDALLRKAMREEVLQILRATSATAIFVTHDQEEAMSMADEIAVMQSGKILQIDQPNVLYRHPQQPQIADFLGETNYLPGHAHGDVVETTLGCLPLAYPKHGPVGVMIRPEALQLVPDPAGDFIVTHCRYYGHDYIVTLCHVNGQELEARVWAQSGYGVGDRVRVTVQGEVVAFAQNTLTASLLTP